MFVYILSELDPLFLGKKKKARVEQREMLSKGGYKERRRKSVSPFSWVIGQWVGGEKVET